LNIPSVYSGSMGNLLYLNLTENELSDWTSSEIFTKFSIDNENNFSFYQ